MPVLPARGTGGALCCLMPPCGPLCCSSDTEKRILPTHTFMPRGNQNGDAVPRPRQAEGAVQAAAETEQEPVRAEPAEATEPVSQVHCHCPLPA